MLIDLHNHYPMHIHGGPHAGIPLRRWWSALAEEELVNEVSKYLNYQGPDRTPAVSLERIRGGGLDVVLSALYWPSDEIAPGVVLGLESDAPRPGAPKNLLDQLQLVEDDIGSRWRDAVIVKGRADLDRALQSGRTAIVHCVEGGFALGEDADRIKETVAELAARGVAYVTLAHLFWRRVATNAPALPFMSDDEYHRHFPQPDQGLSSDGLTAVEELVDAGIVIDVTHMSKRSLDDTVKCVTKKQVASDVPIIASHAACNLTGDGQYPEYNLTDESIRSITEARGIIGLICCTHYIAPAVATTAGNEDPPECRDESVKFLCRHIERIKEDRAERIRGRSRSAAISTASSSRRCPGSRRSSKFRHLEACAGQGVGERRRGCGQSAAATR